MAQRIEVRQERQRGVVIGGSGLVGGTVVNYFKEKMDGIEILAPNSKKLSLREPSDIKDYLTAIRPDFVVNAAIADINSDPQLSFEVNYLGPVIAARTAKSLDIPYIHISSAATLEHGISVSEDDVRPFKPCMSHYAKSKLMAEKTLQHMQQHEGLDHTIIRLAAVYGNHDHKIQGIQRLLFSIADESLPVLFTNNGVLHSYSNCRKLPHLIHHALDNRSEFTGGDYNFADLDPVELVELIITVKSYLELSYPKCICIPYPIAKMGSRAMAMLLKGIRKFGIKAELPSELIFLRHFYITQTLNLQRLKDSSFKDPFPEETIFTRLPEMIMYYLTRWTRQNLISTYDDEVNTDNAFEDSFLHFPEKLMEAMHKGIAPNFATKQQIRGEGYSADEHVGDYAANGLHRGS